VVRAVVDGVHAAALLGQLALHVRVQAVEVLRGVEAARDAGLVGEHEAQEAGVGEALLGATDAGQGTMSASRAG
jgi:hypothetical protein